MNNIVIIHGCSLFIQSKKKLKIKKEIDNLMIKIKNYFEKRKGQRILFMKVVINSEIYLIITLNNEQKYIAQNI